VSGLSWPEIRNRATAFARDWESTTSERAEAQTFWNEFFGICGVKRRRVALFEQQVKKLPHEGKTKTGRIDVFWRGTMLAEHKSVGEDLGAAHTQALDYFAGLTDDELPPYVIVSDFQRFRFYNLDEKAEVEFKLSELPTRISLFGFIAGYSKIKVRDEDPLNIKAVQLRGELHDAPKRDGYGLDENGKAGRVLQMFLVRVLFCLFADDTGLFPKDSFSDLVERTRDDVADTGALIARLFRCSIPRVTNARDRLKKSSARSPISTAGCSRKRYLSRNSAAKCAGCCSIAVACSGPTSRQPSSAPCSRK
jgi:hypothetical protein